jgi:oxysterol-binding protein-related protein 3/6/7
VPTGHTISWSIQPHKKSINFGIFKHPGTSNSLTPSLPSTVAFEPPPTPALDAAGRPRGSSASNSKNDQSRVVEKLQGMGYKSVYWFGKCEADKVSVGKYDVPEGEGGMYGLVFDNTFSKQVSKTATFVLMTYPTNAPPKSGHNLHFSQAHTAPGGANSKNSSPQLFPASDSTDSLPQELNTKPSFHWAHRPKSAHFPGTTGSQDAINSTFYTGVLRKKRRKRNQGFAKRFFSLDFTSSTLSYYQNAHSSALRGSIPLSLAVIGFDEGSREISVDSGVELWHLKANNKKDFHAWVNALERASKSMGNALAPVHQESGEAAAPRRRDAAEEAEWEKIEQLVGRIAGTRDAVRRLAKDTDPKYLPSSLSALGIGRGNSNTSSPVEHEQMDYFREEDLKSEKVPFWKRKASSSGASPSGLFRRSVSAQLAVPMAAAAPSAVPPLPNGHLMIPKRGSRQPSFAAPEEDVHGHCMEILNDLDAVVSEFSALLSESRARRALALPPLTPRKSMDSASSDEFFDAEDSATVRSGFLTIHRDSEEGSEDKSDFVSDEDEELSSDEEGIENFDRQIRDGQISLYPQKPKSLVPLPLDKIRRRTIIPPAKVNPPSLIGFLRKNVGKDLSTIAMPVSANEPFSLLQKVAEQMEYSELLDSAVAASGDTGEKLLYIAAFAISNFSNARVKERAIRKPFNPMLGETFELVREDKGFRFMAEKVSHRPVRLACQAESTNWTFFQSPMPVQKFWGKSAELNTDGRARVIFHNKDGTSERYSWIQATSFLRNIIAGEKYVEPVGTMTMIHEDTGAKAVATFKAGGMFAGRSEDVTVALYDAQGSVLPLGLVGKWTSHLNLTNAGSDTGKSVWSVGPLVDNAPSRFGFTTFAASLNEITSIEHDKLPVTDSRLRPDQRALEEGDLDHAEALKARLEERQRARRRVMEEHGDVWKPRWFVKTSAEGDSEEIWKLKTGKDGYWDERTKGDWTGVVDVLQV